MWHRQSYVYLHSVPQFNDGNVHIAEMRRDRALGELSQFVDGMFQGSITGSTSSLTSPSRLVMGSTLPGFNFFSGEIAEVLIYSSALSDTDRTAIESYLNSNMLSSPLRLLHRVVWQASVSQVRK